MTPVRHDRKNAPRSFKINPWLLAVIVFNGLLGLYGLLSGGEWNSVNRILWLKNYQLHFLLPILLCLPLVLIIFEIEKRRTSCLLCEIALILFSSVCLLGSVAVVNRYLDFSQPFQLSGEIRGLSVYPQSQVFCSFPGQPDLILSVSSEDYSRLRRKDRQLFSGDKVIPWREKPAPGITLLRVKRGFLGLRWMAEPGYQLNYYPVSHHTP